MNIKPPTTTQPGGVLNNIGKLGASALTAGVFGTVSSGIGGIFNYASNVHKDNTLKAMQDRDFDAAHKMGLEHPSQIPNSNFQVLRGGPHSSSGVRTSLNSTLN